MNNGWPNTEQLWLLRACLLSGAAARDAWENWKSRSDFDQIDPASYKLLPLLSRNPALQLLQDPIFEKCRGIYRRVWVENRLNWSKMLAVFADLQEAGIQKIVLLKGMAMILSYYKDFGARVIGDVDILIGREQVPLADDFFQRHQWKPNVTRFDLKQEHYLNRWHALNFTHHSGMHLDLHWSLIQENCPSIDKLVLRDAKALTFEKIVLYVPNPTDLFFQICVHGVKYSPVPLIRWIADAMSLLKASAKEMDWERLFNLAASAHVCMPLSLALQFLLKEFNAPIPNQLIHQLQVVPSIRLEALEYRFHSSRYGQIAAWYRYCLNHGYLTWQSQLLHLLKYLQLTARLKSPWLIPLFAPYWILKRLWRLVKHGAQAATLVLTAYNAQKWKN